MRVLYINHTYRPSGAGISLSTLLRHLPKDVEKFYLLPRGNEVEALLGAEPHHISHERFLCQFMTTLYNAQLTLPLRAWHLVKAALTFPRLRQLKARWRPDLAHINETTLLAYAYAAHSAGLPVVLHARTALAPRPFEMRLLEKLAGGRGVRIVCIDDEVRDSLPAPCQKIARVIYNPIELGAAPTQEEILAQRTGWGFAADDFVIGQVASLHPQKGIWLILRLAEKLCAEFPKLCFVLVGDDSNGEGPMLRDAIAARGLSRRVVLPGYSTQLARVYGSLDVALCLFGGALGGVGRAAYEAAAAAKPLIATLPNPRDSRTLEHEVSGLLHTPEDEAGVEASMRRLILDSAFAKNLGAQAHTLIAARHDPALIAGQMMAIYREVIAERSRPRI